MPPGCPDFNVWLKACLHIRLEKQTIPISSKIVDQISWHTYFIHHALFRILQHGLILMDYYVRIISFNCH